MEEEEEEEEEKGGEEEEGKGGVSTSYGRFLVMRYILELGH